MRMIYLCHRTGYVKRYGGKENIFLMYFEDKDTVSRKVSVYSVSICSFQQAHNLAICPSPTSEKVKPKGKQGETEIRTGSYPKIQRRNCEYHLPDRFDFQYRSDTEDS